jgi:type IV pilus assembly protein PilE
MRNKMRGMTLIELIVVVAIIALLATIAIPSYRQFLLRSHRAEAKSALLNLAAAQEKFYLQTNTYADNDLLDDAPPAGLGLTATTVNGHYTVAITDGDEDSFAATATATGGQAQDSHCASFTINQAGTRTATSDDCW